jgi:hypothetical protein
MKKWTIRIVLGLFVCLSSVVAFAQDAAPAPEAATVFCGDLAEADCTLLQQSAEAMNSLSSATFNLDVQMAFNIPEADSPQTLSITGDGSFLGRPVGIDMQSMQGGNPAEMFSMMGDALRQFRGDVNLAISLPPMLLEEADATGNIPNIINLETRLVDGVAYLNADSLKPLVEATGDELPAGFSGWVGFDLIQFFTSVMSANPQIMSQMSMGAVNPDTAAIFSNPTIFEDAVTIERGADVDGAAAFTFTLDFAKLATDPAFIELMGSQMEASGQTLTDEQLQAGMAAMGQMGDTITLTSTQTIDPATGYVNSFIFDMSFDGSKLPMTETTTDSSSTTPIPSVTFTVNVSLADFNSAPEITVPENATMAPPEIYDQLSKGMGGMGSSVGGVSSGGVTSPSVEIPAVVIPTIEIPTIVIPTIEIPVIGATATPSS